MGSGVNWEEISSLRVVCKLSELIERRFGVGIFGLSLAGELFWLNQAGAARRSWAREQISSVLASARRVSFIEKDMERRELSLDLGRCITVAVGWEGQLQGVVFTGPFLCAEDAPAKQDTLQKVPLLRPPDIEYLSDLTEMVAHEVVSFAHELRQDHEPPPGENRYPAIIGRSRAMREVFRLLDKIAETDSTVLIQGENGTGKELIARAIHEHSARKAQRFVVQNCSAFNDNLLDSELFGHKKGAFTGAIVDKRGLFEVADKGTFFLDEIGDMSPQLQVKLLRVLEEGTFLPVGDVHPRRVDVRIIAATNRDLKKMVETGEFREDLYYRIHVLHVVAPPLRQRREDIPLLAEHFLQRLSQKHSQKEKHLSRGCLTRFLEYSWPGNVRELENEIERLWVLSGDAKLLDESLLSPRILEKTSPPTPQEQSAKLPMAVEALERRMILDSLKKNHWNKTRAAEDLGVSRRNLIRKCQAYELYPPRGRARG